MLFPYSPCIVIPSGTSEPYSIIIKHPICRFRFRFPTSGPVCEALDPKAGRPPPGLGATVGFRVDKCFYHVPKP